MSKQVDERVVSMQFDNKHFESNVKTSMSTLDKLKAKLDLKGASKGLENIDSAAKKVNMSGLGAGVEAVSAKFSALQVMGVTALANITNSAVNAGKRIVSALTIDPIKTGFQEYETQINAVQTILSNTRSKGTTIDDVNRALEELNKYADQTIYNFTEMTRNIGTFTAAGVDLETSTNAIKGIANLAAVSGSTSQQAATAMYQLSQAMSSGSVKLMDWNSVVNAGMGGQVFQDALKETARVHGVNIDAMIEKQGSFRETLSDGWLTTEILTDTLQKFTLTTEGLTEAQIEANREMLRAKGYTEDQIDAIFALGQDATDAATKVKTFTQLWDVLKESAQSGWAQTWKIIVGDFEEAKALFTPLADMLTGFINKMSDARNNFLNAVLYPWKVIEDKLNGAGLGKIKKTIESVTDLSKTLEYYQQVMHDVWMGDYKNANTGRYGLLDAAGHDHRVIQDLVNLSDTYYKGQGYKYQLTIEDVQNSQRKFGVAVSESSETVVEMTEVLENLTDEQLKNAGLTEEEIKLYRMLADEAKRTGKPITELIKRMSEVDGRTLLLDSLRNIGDILVGTFKAIGEAWDGIFDPPSIVRAYTVLETINNFTKKLRLTEDILDENGEVIGRKLNPNGEKLMRTFKGIFAVLDIITTILGGGFKIAFKVVTTLLGMFNLNILDFTALVGDALVAFRDWLKGLFDFDGFIKKITPHVVELGKDIKELFVKAKEFIGPATEKAKEWFIAFKDSHIIPFLERLGKGLKNTFGKVANIFKPAIDGVKKWIDSLKTSDNLAYDIVTGIANGLVSGVKLIGKAISTLATDGWEGLKSLFNTAKGSEIGDNIIQGLANGIKDGAKIVWEALVELAKDLIAKFEEKLGIESPSTVFFAIGGFIVAGLLLGLRQFFPEVWATLKDFGEKCIETFKDIDWGSLIALVSILGTLFVANKFATALKNLTEPLDEFGEAAERLSRGVANYMNAKAFQELAKAIAILVACVVVLTLVDTTKMWHAVGAVGAMVVLVGLLMGVFAWVSKGPLDVKGALDITKLALVMVALAAAIGILALALAKIAGLSDDDLFKGGVVIGAFAGLIVGLMAATRLAGPDALNAGISLIAIVFAIRMLIEVTKYAAELDGETMIKGVIVVGIFGMLVAGLIATTRLAGGEAGAAKLGGTILAISFAIGILSLAARICAGMTPTEMVKALISVGVLSYIIVGLIAATRLAGGEAGAAKLGGTILAIAFAIGTLALVATLCGYLTGEKMIKGGAAIAAFSLIVVGLIAAVRYIGGPAYAKQMGQCILSISFAIGVLALIAVLLGFVSLEHLAKGIAIVGVLSGIVAGLIYATKGAKDCHKNLLMMAIIITLLAGALVGLSFLPTEGLAAATAALTSVIGIFTLLMNTFKTLPADKYWKQRLASLLSMAAVVAILGVVVYGLSRIKNPDAAIKCATALSELILALAGALYVSSLVGTDWKSLAIGIVALAAMTGPLWAFAASLAAMPKLSNSDVEMTKAVVQVMIVMTALLVPLTIIGLLISATYGLAALGIVALAAMTGPLWAFAGSLAGMPKISDSDVKTVKAVIQLMVIMEVLMASLILLGMGAYQAVLGIIALTAMVVPLIAFAVAIHSMPKISDSDISTLNTVLLALPTIIGLMYLLLPIGALAPLAIAGIAALNVFIIDMAALITALGALFQIKWLEKSLDKGIDILIKLADGLGRAIGAFVVGFSSTVMTLLPLLGITLSMFMTSAQPFLDGVSKINKTHLAGIAILGTMIGTLLVADWLTNIAFFFGANICALGLELSAFMVAATPFFMGLNMFTPAMTDAARNLTKLILAITVADVVEGIKSVLNIDGGLDTFGTKLAAFGTSMKTFFDSIADFTKDDLKKVDIAATAGKKMAEMAEAIPKSGGWAQMIMGEQDMTKFSASIVAFGEALVAFGGSVGTLTKDQINRISDATKAGKALAELEGTIPKKDGWAQTIMGSSEIDTFGMSLESFGKSMIKFNDAIKDTEFATKKVDEVIAIADKLVNAEKSLPKADGVWQQITGAKDLGAFGFNLKSFGDGIKNFALSLVDVDLAATKTKVDEIKPLVESIKNNVADPIVKAIGSYDDVSSFGDGLVSLTKGIKDLLSAVKGIKGGKDGEDTKAVKALGDLVDTMKKEIKGLATEEAKQSVEYALEFFALIDDLIYNIHNAVVNSELITDEGISKFDKIQTALDKMSEIALGASLSATGSSSFGISLTRFEKLTTFITDLTLKNFSGVDKLTDAIKKLSEIDSEKFGTNWTNLGEISCDAFLESFAAANAKAEAEGLNLVDKVTAGVKAGSANLTTVLNTTVTSLSSYTVKFYTIGGYMMMGLAGGITNNAWRARNAAQDVADDVERIIRSAWKVNSPSKLFYKIALGVGEGIENAFYDSVSGVSRATEELAGSAIHGFSDTVRMISEAINTDIDAEPTIRPVFDLSELKSGAATINGMLDGNRTLSVDTATIGSLSASMSKLQNGNNSSELLSAIRGLRKDVANTPRNTYSINGINVTEGSDVADAIETIVRAIKVEGRT